METKWKKLQINKKNEEKWEKKFWNESAIAAATTYLNMIIAIVV